MCLRVLTWDLLGQPVGSQAWKGRPHSGLQGRVAGRQLSGGVGRISLSGCTRDSGNCSPIDKSFLQNGLAG